MTEKRKKNPKVELPDISKLPPFIISQQPWALFTRINDAVYQVAQKKTSTGPPNRVAAGH